MFRAVAVQDFVCSVVHTDDHAGWHDLGNSRRRSGVRARQSQPLRARREGDPHAGPAARPPVRTTRPCASVPRPAGRHPKPVHYEPPRPHPQVRVLGRVLVSHTVSMWKKPVAMTPSAWAVRNSRQVGSDCRGAGPVPVAFKISQTVEVAESGQLAPDPSMSPLRVLCRKPENERLECCSAEWASVPERGRRSRITANSRANKLSWGCW